MTALTRFEIRMSQNVFGEIEVIAYFWDDLPPYFHPRRTVRQPSAIERLFGATFEKRFDRAIDDVTREAHERIAQSQHRAKVAADLFVRADARMRQLGISTEAVTDEVAERPPPAEPKSGRKGF